MSRHRVKQTPGISQGISPKLCVVPGFRAQVTRRNAPLFFTSVAQDGHAATSARFVPCDACRVCPGWGLSTWRVQMRYQIKQIYCRPWLLNGLSLRLMESHYE